MSPGASPDTRAAILDHAIDLVQARGFDSFSYRDLAERIGIRAASIHYHFPSKEDLGVAVIEGLAARYQQNQAEIERTHVSPSARLRALLQGYNVGSCHGQKVCGLSCLLASFGALPPRMQEALRRAQEAMHSRLAVWLEEGRAGGEFRFPGSAFDQASLVHAVLQHGMQQARAGDRWRLEPLLSHLLATMA